MMLDLRAEEPERVERRVDGQSVRPERVVGAGRYRDRWCGALRHCSTRSLAGRALSGGMVLVVFGLSASWALAAGRSTRSLRQRGVL